METQEWWPDSPEAIRRTRRMVVIATVVGVLIILGAIAAYLYGRLFLGTALLFGGCFFLSMARGLVVENDERGCIWAGVGVLFGIACTGVIVWVGIRYLFG
jgi:Na+-translocating ferredoxin:NAD+ oxidoreductase RnfE subunit